MGNYIQKGLGQRIQKLRRDFGYSQEQFAEKIGIAINTLSNIERGNAFMTAQTMEKIIHVLNINPQELFLFSDDFSEEESYKYIIYKVNLIKKNKHKLEILEKFLKYVL